MMLGTCRALSVRFAAICLIGEGMTVTPSDRLPAGGVFSQAPGNFPLDSDGYLPEGGVHLRTRFAPRDFA